MARQVLLTLTSFGDGGASPFFFREYLSNESVDRHETSGTLPFPALISNLKTLTPPHDL